MEPANTLLRLPSGKVLRRGQQQAVEAARDGRPCLNIQIPTGLGKTLIGCVIYSEKKASGEANRMLVIFPTDAQLEQYVKDGPSDLKDAGVDGPLSIVDVRYYGTEAIKKHKRNQAQIFVTTIQSLTHAKVQAVVNEIMTTGQWMVVVDEYHHYGDNKPWANAVKALHHRFRLCMSATPFRPGNDGAFGKPDVVVTYRDAIAEGAVKKLCGHCYHYIIDTLDERGEVRSYTTAELIADAGGDSPDQIEKLAISRKMRWSPKYVSPLVYRPIERMVAERLVTPGGFLQAIVGAMCVSHAKLVCEQIRAMFSELRVDWVGTGENGRPDEKNREVLKRFCPPKDDRGERHPTLDVLVHVGLAGEGLDSIHVSEIVHLNAARKCNANDQENGRGARTIPHARGVICNINYDASSGYSGYEGIEGMTRAMDDSSPDPDAVPPEKPDGPLDDLPELPEEPAIQIYDLRLDQIDSGDPDVQRYEKLIVSAQPPQVPYTEADLADPNHHCHSVLLECYKIGRRREAAAHDEQSTIAQWRESVKNATRTVAGVAVRLLYDNERVENKVMGEIMKRINARKKLAFGEVSANVEVCKNHWQWLRKLEQEMRQKREVPEWLR